jgi:sugar/nucleoside kinase (ribokinase family)
VTVGVLGAGSTDWIELGNDRVIRRPGGTPLYAARALRFAGAEPVVVETGRFESRLSHADGRTSQELVTVPDPLSDDRVAELLERLRGCDWVLMGGQSAGDFPPSVLRLIADAGHAICLDGQGLARGPSAGPVQLGPVAQESVAGVTALKVNEAEHAAAGPLDVPELLLTRGRLGATIVVRGHEPVEVPAGPVTFGDPTGAGDSFSALYILARGRGEEPAAAARYAVGMVEELYST